MRRWARVLLTVALLSGGATPALAQESGSDDQTSETSRVPTGGERSDTAVDPRILLGSGELELEELVLVPLVEAAQRGWASDRLPGGFGVDEPGDDGSALGQSGSCVGAGVDPLSVEEADAREAEHRLKEQELLDASGYGKGGLRRGATKGRKRGVLQPDPDAVDVLWDQIRDSEVGDLESGAVVDCVAHACYSERIEDVRFGHLSGEGDGAFAEYVDAVGGFIEFANRVGAPSASLIERSDLALAMSSDRLGQRPSAASMPVFYYCRRGVGADDPLELRVEGLWPRFGWATSVEEQFDVEGARLDAMEALRTELWGAAPVIETIPPVEVGYTFVNLPMWLWLVDPLEGAVVEAVSEQGTARLRTRATLVDVTWAVGDATIVCRPEQMRAFRHGVDSIADTSVECVRIFSELVDYVMSASARYEIEEQISFRGHRDLGWPDTAWVPHPDLAARTVIVTATTPPMRVHQILSVNIPLDLTNAEIATLAD